LAVNSDPVASIGGTRDRRRLGIESFDDRVRFGPVRPSGILTRPIMEFCHAEAGNAVNQLPDGGAFLIGIGLRNQRTEVNP
jgi:hypothetical protein